MTETVTLADGQSRVTLAPGLGAAIARFEALTGSGPVPVLRAGDPAGGDALALGCNPLLPFSNRIHGGGFVWQGVRHDIAPNHPGQAMPIHGDAFQRPWDTAMSRPDGATLRLRGGAIGPWRYDAEIAFELRAGCLSVRLTARNTGPGPLPFGGGFHPWFPRLPGTRLGFRADRFWPAPAAEHQAAAVPETAGAFGSFTAPRALPDGLIDHAFGGWRGPARILQPELGIELEVDADPALGTAIVFSPGAGAGFFCFEPVSHPVDAVNRDGTPGMQVLQPDQTLSLGMTIGWRALAG